MISFTEKDYKNIAKLVADEIRSEDYKSIEIEYETKSFTANLNLTVIMYWIHDNDGAGKPFYEINDIVPIWWEMTTHDLDGEYHNNDFQFSQLKEYLFVEI